MSECQSDYQTDVRLKEQVEHALQPPSMYKVILNNDDFTPMDFVVQVLKKYFSLMKSKPHKLCWMFIFTGKDLWGLYC